MFGSTHDDVIMGDDAPNTLAGRDGNDEISSGGGGSLECSNPNPGITFPFACADDLFGEAGDDTLIGGNGLDVAFYFDAPPMTVDLSTGTATGEGNDALSDIEGVQGSRNDDTLIGDTGDNVFDPDQGNDTVTGGGGTDLVSFTDVASISVDLAAGTASGAYLGGGGQWTYALSGIEDAWGTPGADAISGDAGPNDVKGFAGNDVISGRDGNDDLQGGKGADRLDGEAGTDTP